MCTVPAREKSLCKKFTQSAIRTIFGRLHPLAFVFFLLVGAVSCADPDTAFLSTEFGKTAWTDYAEYAGGSPGSDFYIGAWTHTVESMGDHTGTGNDYPFVIPCSEMVGGLPQHLLTISGNIVYDAAIPGYIYNQNITTDTGDYAVAYIRQGELGGSPGQPDEAAMRGWVYVAWHYRQTVAGTVVRQYAKFGPTAPMVLTAEAVINGQGGWPPAPTPTPEFVTPVSICVGGGDRGSARLYMQYAKVYVMTQAPTLAEADAIALRTAPDPAAWADWPLIAGNMDDVSGNGRDLTMKGSAGSGIAGPGL